MQLDNVRLLTDDFARAFAFYADTLGLPVRFGEAEGPYAEFGAGETSSIGLFVRELMPGAGAAFGDQAVIVLAADPLEETVATLRARGAEVGAPQTRTDWGIRVAHLRDPDGRLIELFEPVEPAGPGLH